MRRWLQFLLLGVSAQRVTALASSASSGHLVGHEAVSRTRRFPKTAEVSDSGEVATFFGESVAVTAADDVVYGSIVLMVLNPPRFTKDRAVMAAVQGAIASVAIEPGAQALELSVQQVRVSLALLPQFSAAARVDFNVAFTSRRERQVFMRTIATDGGRRLASSINEQVPLPFKGRCQLPGLNDDVRLTLGHMSISDQVVTTASPSGPERHGAMTYTVRVTSARWFLKDAFWQEAAAMAIAMEAWVSRLQVGTLMAAESNDTVSVLFWLTAANETFRQEAIDRVESLGADSMMRLTVRCYHHWMRGSRESRDDSATAYGRVALRVPKAQRFVESSTGLVERAIAKVAASPGLQASNLSVRAVNASLSAAQSATDAVWVDFRVAFASPRDRQIFAWDVALDGGQKLIRVIGEQVPTACSGRCGLLELDAARAPNVLAADNLVDLGRPFGSISLLVSWSALLAGDPVVLESMSLAISELAKVPVLQVGFVMEAELSFRLRINYWVALPDIRVRQAVVQRMERDGPAWWRICWTALMRLDKVSPRFDTREPAGRAHGSIALEVLDARRFAGDAAVQDALRSSIAELAAVPDSQVLDLKVHPNVSDKVVQVSFWLAFGSRRGRQDFTQAMASDGGQNLTNRINNRLPEPFKGRCQLPGQVQQKANSTRVRVVPAIGVTYGALPLYVFHADRLVQDREVQERMAATIAEVADVPRLQVGMLMSAESRARVNVDFWLATTNTTSQQAAIQRFKKNWHSKHLLFIVSPVNETFSSPVFLACGGTLTRPC